MKWHRNTKHSGQQACQQRHAHGVTGCALLILDLLLQLYDEMGSRHRVRPPLLNIIKTATVPNDHCKRDNTKQFHQAYDDKINKQVRVKFPLTRKLVR